MINFLGHTNLVVISSKLYGLCRFPSPLRGERVDDQQGPFSSASLRANDAKTGFFKLPDSLRDSFLGDWLYELYVIQLIESYSKVSTNMLSV